MSKKVMSVIGHPKADISFSYAVFNKINETLEKNSFEVYKVELYKVNFDSSLTLDEIIRRYSMDEIVQEYKEKLQDCDAYIFTYPIWWGLPPAILKGFVDRIFRPPFAYDNVVMDDGREKILRPLEGKKCLIFPNANSQQKTHSNEIFWQDDIGKFIKLDVKIQAFYNLSKSTYEERVAYLDSVGDLALKFLS